MVDRENREDWRRERSLLALGKAVRGDEERMRRRSPSATGPIRHGARTPPHAPHRPLATRGAVESCRQRHRLEPAAIARPPGEAVSGPRRHAGERPLPKPSAGALAQLIDAPLCRRAPLFPRADGGNRDDDDDQEWKPLIDPMQVYQRHHAIQAADRYDDDPGNGAGRCHRCLDAEEIRSHHAKWSSSRRPEARPTTISPNPSGSPMRRWPLSKPGSRW